jgi:RNA polymerase sigma-70 factor (ECF subfamily)
MGLSGKHQHDPSSCPEDEAQEAALVSDARREDAAAWTTLVRCHQEAVFRLAYLLLGSGGDRATAEDVAQETFIRAYEHLDTFEDGRPLRPWLLAIAANLARNRRRSVGRYWHALRRWWQVQRIEVETARPTQEERDDARLLRQAIEQLPAVQREALYLRYFLEVAEADMAAVWGVAPGTVKSRLYRARQALQDVVEEAFPLLAARWQQESRSEER